MKDRRPVGRPKGKSQHAPDSDRDRQMRHRYGLTLADYDTMLEAQDGVCAICRKPETRDHGNGPVRLAVDHNHDTGEVRKLLCSRCNTGIAKFNEDVALLLAAAQYVLEFS